MGWRQTIFNVAFAPRLKQIDHFRRHPLEVQRKMLRQRLRWGRDTLLGREWGLRETWSAEEFAARVPLFSYEQLKPYIERMWRGERNLLVPGRVKRYAQSSGTTSDRSKYIPITMRSVMMNHSLGMRDVMALYGAAHPHSRVLDGKMLTLGGSCRCEQGNLVGDLSAVIFRATEPWNGFTCTPSGRVGLLPDFAQKCEAIARHCSGQDIRGFAGVPSWNLELMRHILDYTGKRNLLEVWPRLELFTHGGVSFSPYRRSFEELIPDSRMHYVETYNASEGFFAMADDARGEDMLLMLDYGTYYEFEQEGVVVPLEGVKCGERYALIITANNGLWRYRMGDRVTFTSLDPYRIRFAGRTSQSLNVFGEELVVEQVERALEQVCRTTGARVVEYTVAPRYMTLTSRGGHEWALEFEREPADRERFAAELDAALRAQNSDYDAKRNSTLEPLRLNVLPLGSCYRWMRQRKKNKLPRMVESRQILEELLHLE